VDESENKIGTLACLWADESGQPAFLGVKTGWFFGKNHVVPAHAAGINERGGKIRVPFSSDVIKDAPTIDADMIVDRETERKIYDYYRGKGAHLGEEQPSFPREGEEEESTREEARTREGEGFSTTAPPRQTSPQAPSMEETRIPLREERLKVGTREVETGGVRLRKIVRTENVNQPVELKREEIVVERVPASEAQAGAAEGKAFEQQDIYVPLRREEPVVEKESRVTGEVRARKTTETEQQNISGQIRKEDVEVEHNREEEHHAGER